MRITVAVPYFHARPYIRQAVESILAQTYENLLVVVVNDGDDEPPWDELVSINDPRLVCFNLPVNRGTYFATDIILNATPDVYFAIQDADDWSEPTRFERLLAMLQAQEANFVTSAGIRHTGQGGKAVKRYDGFPSRGQPLTDRFIHRFMHQGIYRASALQAVGGYFSGFRYTYDMLLTNFMLMTGNVAYAEEALYHRRVQPNSVTQSKTSGFRSPVWNEEVQQLRDLYRHAFADYQRYSKGIITLDTLTKQIHHLASINVSAHMQEELVQEAQRLRVLFP